jgi:lipopolysaccharide export LptBFGC system permease protein LptF
MRILRKTLILSLAFGFSLLALSLTTSSSAAAESADSYVYTAKSGDSYTELARSSIIKYDQSNKDLELNAAQVTAAETWVTQEAGSPAINVGQEVSVSKTSVEKFAKQASSLDDSAKARWQKYADASSITNGELKDKVLPTVDEDQAASSNSESSDSSSTDQSSDASSEENKTESADQTKTEDNKDGEKKSSKRWIVVAVVVLLVLAALSLIRSSNAKDE